MRPNAPARKSCKKRVPPPSSASSRMPRHPSPPLNYGSCSAPSSTLTHTRLPMTWPSRSRARTRTNSAPPRRFCCPPSTAFTDDKLTGFALRLALTGHVAIPREGEVDFLAEAETAFAPPQPKNAVSKKPKVKTPTPIKAASKPAPKKTAAKKKAAA